jgi:hypothetical protein
MDVSTMPLLSHTSGSPLLWNMPNLRLLLCNGRTALNLISGAEMLDRNKSLQLH